MSAGLWTRRSGSSDSRGSGKRLHALLNLADPVPRSATSAARTGRFWQASGSRRASRTGWAGHGLRGGELRAGPPSERPAAGRGSAIYTRLAICSACERAKREHPARRRRVDHPARPLGRERRPRAHRGNPRRAPIFACGLVDAITDRDVAVGVAAASGANIVALRAGCAGPAGELGARWWRRSRAPLSELSPPREVSTGRSTFSTATRWSQTRDRGLVVLRGPAMQGDLLQP